MRNILKNKNHLVSKFSYFADTLYVRVPQIDDVAENSNKAMETMLEDTHLLTIWRQQFVDALRVLHFILLVCL